MANYRINEKNKTISIGANLTDAEKNTVALYLAAGYKARPKSEIKSKQAKEKANALPKKAEIETILLDNKMEKELALFREKCDSKLGGNFFKARSWYMTDIKPIIDEKNEEK